MANDATTKDSSKGMTPPMTKRPSVPDRAYPIGNAKSDSFTKGIGDAKKAGDVLS